MSSPGTRSIHIKHFHIANPRLQLLLGCTFYRPYPILIQICLKREVNCLGKKKPEKIVNKWIIFPSDPFGREFHIPRPIP